MTGHYPAGASPPGKDGVPPPRQSVSGPAGIGPARHEVGAAVADFALVAGLLMLLFAAVLQLGLGLHLRNTLISCAAEGARLGARADAQPGDAVARTRDLIRRSMPDRYAQDITESVESVDGVAVRVVRVRAPLPLLGPIGPDRGLDVVGRAFLETQ